MTSPAPPGTLRVAPMCQHSERLPQVREWFCAEWPGWYGPGGPGNIDADLRAFSASSTQLPIGLLLFEDGAPVGAAALKAESIPSHAHLGPWAAAGFVLPSHRGRGLGAALLHGLVETARGLGWVPVYCGTRTANSLLQRCGWQVVDETLMNGQPLQIFRSAP